MGGSDQETTPSLADHELHIYLPGLSGWLTELSISHERLKEKEQEELGPQAYGYVRAEAGPRT